MPQFRPILKILWKSIHNCWQTNKQTKKRKNIASLRKKLQSFLISKAYTVFWSLFCSTKAKKQWQSVSRTIGCRNQKTQWKKHDTINLHVQYCILHNEGRTSIYHCTQPCWNCKWKMVLIWSGWKVTKQIRLVQGIYI